MFTRLYRTRLQTGDKTALAYQMGKSEEWVSRLTRFGGDPCPAAKYFRWYCQLAHVNAAAADALHEELNARVGEVRHEREGGTQWNPHQTAATLVKVAAEAVAALVTDCNSDDVPALLDLKVAVEAAIEKCHTRREPTKLKGVK